MRLSKMRQPKTFKQLANHPHVMSAHTEGNDPQYGTEYWVYLEFPYISPMTETQTIHEYGMKSTLREFKDREINYAFYLSSEFLGSKPEKPETKINKNGQLELPIEELKYKEELKKYTKKVNDQWNDCMEHCIKYTDQSHLDILFMMYKKFRSVPNYDPNYIQYDPKNFTNI